MIRLIAFTQNTDTPYELDLFGDETIAITFNVDDIRTVSDKIGSYSKDFDLPATKNNNKFFESVNNIANVGVNFSPYISVKAELYEDSNLLYSGRLILQEMLEKEGERFYTATLISSAPSLFNELDGKTFADLDFTNLSHAWSVANIEASWTNTGVTLVDGTTTTDIYYPLVDNPVGAEGFIISTQNYTPFVRLKHVIDKIADLAGFKFSSDFFNADYFKSIYMDTSIAGNTEGEQETYGVVKQNVATTTDDDGNEVAGSFEIPSSLTTLILGNEVQDANNLYNAATGIYTAPVDDTQVAIFAQLPLRNVNGSLSYSDVIKVFLTKTIDGTTTTEELDNAFINYAGGNATVLVDAGGSEFKAGSGTIYINEGFVLPNAGDTFKIQVQQTVDTDIAGDEGDNNAKIVNEGEVVGLVDGSTTVTEQIGTRNLYFDIFSSQGISIDEGLRVNRGEVELTTFLRDIVKMFNLIIEETENPNELRIEPFEDFVATGKRLDWTKKTDIDNVKRVFVEMPTKIILGYNNDEDDFRLSKYKEETGLDYGSMIVNPTNNLSTADEQVVKEVKLETISASTFRGYSSGAAILSAYTKPSGEYAQRFNNRIRLCFKNTQQVGVVEDQLNIIPLGSPYVGATHFDNNLAALTEASNDLNFGFVLPILSNYNYTIPTNTLYNKFWHTYITERYSGDLRVVSYFINLTAADIHNFTFANTVLIDNLEYRVNKIEYNAGANGMSKVELYVI